MIYLKRRLLIKRHKRRLFLDTRHLMEEREEKPRAGHRLPMMRNRNGRLLMAMVHVSPTTAIPVYEEIERLGSWLRRRDHTFIKSYNGDSLVGKKYECLSLLIYSTELPLSHNGENLVVAVDDDGLFTERITHFSDVDKDIIEAVKAKGRLVKPGSSLFTHIHFAGDQTLLSYIEPFPVGMLLA
ncbi:hypothetical protein YC2023_051793 [Brassica napus]